MILQNEHSRSKIQLDDNSVNYHLNNARYTIEDYSNQEQLKSTLCRNSQNYDDNNDELMVWF